MPTPKDGEMHDDFIERCIPMVLEEGTAKDQDQAVAICNSMWEQAHEQSAAPQEVRGMNYMRAFRQETETNEEGSPIRFVASTEGIKRDGKELKSENWRLTNYQANPVVLWVHAYMGERPPIGRADNVRIDGKQLVADVTFDQQDEFARQVESKYRRGFLNAVSVGWQDVSENKRTYHDLMDISAVPVPADPQALKLQEARALLADFETPTLDLSDVDAWAGVASAMLALYRPDSAIEDETRHGVYIALERAYRKLGKTAPEWRTLEEIEALSETEVRGLFLEGEHARVGAVLSSRNRGDLEQAQALIQKVLDSARKEEEPRAAETPPGEAEDDDNQRSVLYTLHELFNKEFPK